MRRCFPFRYFSILSVNNSPTTRTHKQTCVQASIHTIMLLVAKIDTGNNSHFAKPSRARQLPCSWPHRYNRIYSRIRKHSNSTFLPSKIYIAAVAWLCGSVAVLFSAILEQNRRTHTRKHIVGIILSAWIFSI